MKQILNGIYDFLNLPVVQAITSIILIAFGINIIFRTYKVLKQPYIDLYNKHNLQCIAFGLSSAIDQYQDYYTNDDLLCNEHYVKICVLHREICKLLGENTEGRKLTCSK